METIRRAQKACDFDQAFRALFASDEMPFGSGDQSHYSEAGCPHRNKVCIAGQISMAMPALGCAASQ